MPDDIPVEISEMMSAVTKYFDQRTRESEQRTRESEQRTFESDVRVNDLQSSRADAAQSKREDISWRQLTAMRIGSTDGAGQSDHLSSGVKPRPPYRR